MKTLLKRISSGAIIAIIAVLVLSVAALAAALVIIPWDMEIIPGEVSAAVFIDPEATIPASAVHWGQLPRGSHHELVLYVKNTGVEPVELSLTIPGDVSTSLDYSFTPASFTLSPGQVGPITLEFDVLVGAPLGPLSGVYEVVTP